MKENSFSQQIKKAATDEWYTLPYSVEIILPYLKEKNFKKVWCPFDKKDSEFVKILRKENYQVVHGHIDTGEDFFKYEEAPTGCEVVVSNPPFSKRDAIFEKLYEMNIPFALIMNSNGLFDSKKRFEIFKNNNFEMLIPQGRMNFHNGAEVRNSPNFQSIYICNGILKDKIMFTYMNKD